MTEVEAPPPLAPDDLDEHFAPRIRPGVVAVPIGDETVLVGELGQASVVDPLGGLVWQFLDGETAVESLVTDFAEVLEADPETVRRDLLDFVRSLGRFGLLDGVAEPVETGDVTEITWSTPEPVPVGDVLEDFTLSDLEGRDVSLHDWRGTKVLLVNWSPGCGFCVQIVGDLARAAPALAAENIQLLFVASGEADEIRQLFAGADFEPTALVRSADVDPFGRFGTPAAYLLNEDGRVDVPLAVGAVEVPALVDDLVGAPREAGAEPPPSDSGEEVAYLPAPRAACGPGGGARSNSTEWHGTRAYRFGEFHVGVRHNGESTAEVLDRLFVDARVDDRRVPDNYSVALHAGNNRGSRQLHLLVKGGTTLVRSRSGARTVSALLNHLTAELSAPTDDLLHVNALATVRDGRAVLLPGGLRFWATELQPRMARHGFAFVDVPFASVDSTSGELVVSEPALAFDPAVFDGLDDGARMGGERPWVRPGRYPIADWYVAGTEDEAGRLSPGRGVAEVLPSTFFMDDVAVVGARVAEVLARVEVHWLLTETPDVVAAQLASAPA